MELAFERLDLRFAQEQATAFGVLRSRELIEVTLTGADGIVGHGEAAALEPYDGVSTDRVLAALDAYRAPVAAASAAAAVRCSTRVARWTTCPRRSRRSTSRCGIWQASAPAVRSAIC